MSQSKQKLHRAQMLIQPDEAKAEVSAQPAKSEKLVREQQ